MTTDVIRSRVLNALTAGPRSRRQLLVYYLNGVRVGDLEPVLGQLVRERRVVETFPAGDAGAVYRLAEAAS